MDVGLPKLLFLFEFFQIFDAYEAFVLVQPSLNLQMSRNVMYVDRRFFLRYGLCYLLSCFM